MFVPLGEIGFFHSKWGVWVGRFCHEEGFLRWFLRLLVGAASA